jgi:hypothetical protein
MNDWTVIAVTGRVLERLLVVLFAGLSVYLGYRLFLQIPDFRDSKGEVKLPSMNLSVTFSRVGPGIFFAIFGVAVLVASYVHEVTVELPLQSQGTGTEAKAKAKVGGKYQGANPTAEEQEESVRRSVVAQTIRSLNGLQTVVSKQRLNTEGHALTIHDSKLVLMELVWDPRWGDAAVFKEAVAREGAADDRALSQQTRDAVAFYRQTDRNK